MRSVGLVVVVLSMAACTPRQPSVVVAPLPADAAVTVLPFAAPTSVVSYEPPTATLGEAFAAQVVAELGMRGRAASLGTAATPGIVTVTGRLLRVDGGSRAKRFWVGFGAGRASLSAEGTVASADGTTLATFRERRSASGEAELGFAGDQTLIDKCLRVLARDVAEMIATGRYRQADLGE